MQIIRETTGDVTGEVAGEVKGEVTQLMKILTKPKTRAELLRDLGLKGQANFRDRYLKPALHDGLIEMTMPDKPRSSKQKYRLPEKGQKMIQSFDRS